MAIMNDLTSPAFAELLASGKPVVALLPVGSVEPHGPHLPLGTDTTISVAATKRAVELLKSREIHALIAPSVPYGVTNCAAGFAGAVSISEEALISYLQAVVTSMLDAGIAHVCLVNNHLEPEHISAVYASIKTIEKGRASVACPTTRRWARTLSAEFKSGECHAGQYETSIVMAATPELVNNPSREALPYVPISLSEQLNNGISDFKAMGMSNAYAGDPAQATVSEGNDLLDLLATMIATEVVEAIAS